MKSDVLHNFDMSYLIIFAFFIFSGLFVSVLIWSFQKSRKAEFEIAQNIPFTEEPTK